MRAHRQKTEQLAIPEKRRVNHHIIEMLAADLRMIHEEDVAGMDVVQSIDFDAVLDSHAEIGEKNRQRPLVLRHRPALMIDDADAIVLHLVNHHIVGGPLEHDRHLVGGGLQRAADYFNCDRIQRARQSLSCILHRNPHSLLLTPHVFFDSSFPTYDWR